MSQILIDGVDYLRSPERGNSHVNDTQVIVHQTESGDHYTMIQYGNNIHTFTIEIPEQLRDTFLSKHLTEVEVDFDNQNLLGILVIQGEMTNRREFFWEVTFDIIESGKII